MSSTVDGLFFQYFCPIAKILTSVKFSEFQKSRKTAPEFTQARKFLILDKNESSPLNPTSKVVEGTPKCKACPTERMGLDEYHFWSLQVVYKKRYIGMSPTVTAMFNRATDTQEYPNPKTHKVKNLQIRRQNGPRKLPPISSSQSYTLIKNQSMQHTKHNIISRHSTLSDQTLAPR